MLSLVLYGRNDSYGYNLHKRAALSLNCMAEVLTGDTDEIIFVDYNTPDDYPTFPEAIGDTLTEKARSLLRVIRVRPAVHRTRFESRTHLKAIEPVSRNVAIRRSNPANRWILSTNTDIIFVPRNGPTLTDAISGFGDGFYCAPRIEIPETLWESYNRLDPVAVIAETRHWGSVAHLDEIVFGSDAILYDGPGDFQLMLRRDLFEIHGFHEGMLLGWHVDSNISKRLGLVYGSVGDAAPAVLGYHCDHTRQVTPAHVHKSPKNDSNKFVDEVTNSVVSVQDEAWGLADLALEEIRLDRLMNQTYRRALSIAITEPLATPTKEYYQSAKHDQTTTSPEHVLPFLLDIFSNAPRTDSVLWLGQHGRLLDLFRRCWNELGFTGKIALDCDNNEEDDHFEGIAAFIFNFGVPSLLDREEGTLIVERFSDVVFGEALHQKLGGFPRRIVGVNAIHNRFESLILSNVGCAKTPFSTRLRQGFVLLDVVSGKLQGPQDWTGEMMVGSAGVRDGKTIRTRVNAGGHFAYGPYRTLRPGKYIAHAHLTIVRPNYRFPWAKPDRRRLLSIELVLAETTREVFHLESDKVGDVKFQFSLAIHKRDAVKPIQIRFSSDAVTNIVLHSVKVEPA